MPFFDFPIGNGNGMLEFQEKHPARSSPTCSLFETNELSTVFSHKFSKFLPNGYTFPTFFSGVSTPKSSVNARTHVTNITKSKAAAVQLIEVFFHDIL